MTSVPVVNIMVVSWYITGIVVSGEPGLCKKTGKDIKQFIDRRVVSY